MGTGQPDSLENFVKYAFEAAGLDYRDYVIANDFQVQPVDVKSLSVKPDLVLDWEPTTTVKELANLMVEADFGVSIVTPTFPGREELLLDRCMPSVKALVGDFKVEWVVVANRNPALEERIAPCMSQIPAIIAT